MAHVRGAVRGVARALCACDAGCTGCSMWAARHALQCTRSCCSAARALQAMLAEGGGSCGAALPSLSGDTLLRLCALLAAVFASVMAHRLVQGAAA